MIIESRTEAANTLRGAAEHYESEHRWLHSEVREFLRARGDAGGEAAEDMAQALDALESCTWWLRKAAYEIESGGTRISREDGSGCKAE